MSWLGTAFTTGVNLYKFQKEVLPKMEEEMDVTVWGRPGALKQDLYRLALAFVWGKIQRRNFWRLLPPPGMLMLEYNVEQNFVRVVFRQVTTYAGALLGSVRSKRTIEIFSGIPDSVVGGQWAFTSALPGFVGGSALAFFSVPTNGFEGRTILTSASTYLDGTGTLRSSQSPKPANDQISRSFSPISSDPSAQSLTPNNWNIYPEYLLFAAFSDPCTPSNVYYPQATLTTVPLPPPPYPPPPAEVSIYSTPLPPPIPLSPPPTETQLESQQPPPNTNIPGN